MENNIFIEIFGAVTGFAYVLLEIKQKRLMWIVGGISALTYILVFLKAGLVAAMGLQFYYLAMSLYGWIKWGSAEPVSDSCEHTDSNKITVSKMPGKVFLLSVILSVVTYLALSNILKCYVEDPMPRMDAVIAVMSMLATWWVARKYIENWYLWIITDALSVFMYASQALYATALLYLVYTVAAFAGYMHWRKFS